MVGNFPGGPGHRGQLEVLYFTRRSTFTSFTAKSSFFRIFTADLRELISFSVSNMAEKADSEEKDPQLDLEEPGTPSSNLEADGNVNERALLRKLDYKLLPALSILYLLSFLDRSNVANARIEGLTTGQYKFAVNRR
jgi:hypothetical protein